MITSPSNAKVKLVRSLARRRMRYAERKFVVEGIRLVGEALGAGHAPALVFFSEEVRDVPAVRALLAKLPTADSALEVSESIMQSMSTAETPPGILAVVPFVELKAPESPALVLVLDSIRDPGNVGTILRAARAAGADLVVMAPRTADPYNEKVVRAAMGAHFHVPLRVAHTWDMVETLLKGIPRIYLADAHGALDYTQTDWTRPLAIFVGGEAAGPSEETRILATAKVRIPMLGGTESLNAAMAATLLLFEAGRSHPAD